MKKTVRISPEKSAEPAESDAATGEAALAWAVKQGQMNELTREVAAEVRRGQQLPALLLAFYKMCVAAEGAKSRISVLVCAQ